MRNENVKFDRYGLYSGDNNQLGDTKNNKTSWLMVSLLMVSLKVDRKNKCPTHQRFLPPSWRCPLVCLPFCEVCATVSSFISL
jgi:hypothetical protein